MVPARSELSRLELPPHGLRPSARLALARLVGQPFLADRSLAYVPPEPSERLAPFGLFRRGRPPLPAFICRFTALALAREAARVQRSGDGC